MKKQSKQLLIYLIFITILSNITFAQEKEQRYLHIKGKIDPRLTVSFVSWYRTTTNLENSNCTREDWNTASKKPILDVYGEVIKNKSNFDLKIPIDYPKEDKYNCGYSYSTTEMNIRRLNDKKWFSGYTLLSKKSYAYHHPRENGVSASVEGVKNGHTKKKHYFIGNDLTFNCITEYFKGTDRVHFLCKPKEADWSNGVDTLNNLNINLNIKIDESGGELFKYVPYKMSLKEKFYKWLDEIKN